MPSRFTLRPCPLNPFFLGNTGLADHGLERSHGIAAVSEIDLDNPVRLADFRQFDPGFVRPFQRFKETEPIFFEEIRNVTIRPVV